MTAAAITEEDRRISAEIERRIHAAAPEVTQVLLFGSRARGEARADSDLDLLIVVPDACRKREVAVRIRLALWGIGYGVDIIALTESDLAELRASGAWFHRQMLGDARPLHDAA